MKYIIYLRVQHMKIQNDQTLNIIELIPICIKIQSYKREDPQSLALKKLFEFVDIYNFSITFQINQLLSPAKRPASGPLLIPLPKRER